ncbi:excalibur calcium-binding domain-containing protein [Acidovorax sp. NB1]|uniref:excalibur calcium-binding domain-containing protein n=1 Tax=Acidovorax sp. NB1 TaxID=1943571 RepID=UPI0010D2DE36|nr:excalibur calcium-binding domain-containing protein [Acidovorax sp. NB1]GDY36389.1 DNA-binding protein [Acidovorax sp. NB1]
MRFEGTLTQWNDDRGFGFITPIPAGQDVFVHISAFARDGLRPRLHEALSFEISLNKDGKKQAVLVRRDRLAPALSTAAPPRARRDIGRESSEPRGLPTRIVVFVVACALLAAAYWHFDRRTQRAAAARAEAAAQTLEAPQQRAPAAPAQPLTSSYRCDGRQHCSQMTSCSEAKFFLQNCPGTKMDGNGDGVPCEQQWCTHPLAK